jgi:four helix bundle protein
MTGSKNYRDLIAWQKAMGLAVEVYRVTRDLPKEELYGLVAQMRRAGVSVASNIAEGEGRWNDKEFAHFLRIANGSLRELETQVLLCEHIGYITAEVGAAVLEQTTEVSRIIAGLIRSLTA